MHKLKCLLLLFYFNSIISSSYIQYLIGDMQLLLHENKKRFIFEQGNNSQLFYAPQHPYDDLNVLVFLLFHKIRDTLQVGVNGKKNLIQIQLLELLRKQLNTCLIEWEANGSSPVGLPRSEQKRETWNKVTIQRVGRQKKGNSEVPRELIQEKNPLSTIR